MPSFINIQKSKTLPSQTVTVYNPDETIDVTFGVIFNDLKQKDIDNIIEKVIDEENDFGVTEALNDIVHDYEGWTDLPINLSDIADENVKNSLKATLLIDDNHKFTTNQHSTLLNLMMKSRHTSAVWLTFLNVNNAQTEAFKKHNRRKSKNRR